MPRRAAKVTQADIARARRAVQQTGGEAIIEIAPDGSIRIVPAASLPTDEQAIQIGLPGVAKRKKVVL
jgi:hypothetical protein